MISPCGGCDVTVIAAVVCYLSFFLSGCSLFLYWYWLNNYRDEINPLKGRGYPSDPEGSDCDALEPEPIDQWTDDSTSPHNHNYNGYSFMDETPTTSTQVPDYHQYPEYCQEIANISSCIQHSETDHDLAATMPLYGGSGSRSASASHADSIECNLGQGESDSFIINTITLPPPSSSSSTDFYKNLSTLECIHPHMEDPGGGGGRCLPPTTDRDTDEGTTSTEAAAAAGRTDERGDHESGKSSTAAVSDNPYLNGDTYAQNLFWGLHGIFTNLAEAILSAVFYSGLFEKNLKTTLVWVIGFSSNFIIGNLLYVLLLLKYTNKAKAKQLWCRWLVESAFNIIKDLYYIWVGISFLDNLVHSINVDNARLSDPT